MDGARFEQVRDSIRQMMVEDAIPSVSVAVAQGSEVLWEEGFGWADRERRVAATPHTMYSLASISKPITATGLMVLVERGEVDLDQPVNAYLGDAKLTARAGGEEGATVRRVANHTSGLPLHYQFFYADEPFARPPMDETIRRYGNLIRRPGERYQYSNLGYGVLDNVVSRVSGKPFADFMREEVFLPLGMTHASIDLPPYLAEFEAKRYGSDGVPYPFYDFDHPGASAVYCSAHDLLRFGMFHLGTLPDAKEILTPRARREMQQPTAVMEDDPGESKHGYGIGWAGTPAGDALPRVSHSGGMGGVSTNLVLVPGEGIAVVVLTNGGARLSNATGRVTAAILSTLFPERREHLQGELQQAEEAVRRLREPKEPRAVSELDHRLVGEWRGEVHTYLGTIPLVLRCRESGDIQARLGDAPWTLVNDAALDGDHFSGQMLGTIETPDVRRRDQQLHFDLTLRGDILNGALIAMTPFKSEGGAPGKRVGNALNHWIELRRAD